MWAANVRALPERPEQGVACTEHACRIRPHPDGPTVLLLLGPAMEEDCAAALLLSLEPIHLRCPEPVPDAFDRFDLWRNGAHAVWIGRDEVRVLSDRDVRGDRPWVPVDPGE
jgi:competence protein ComEC